MTEHISLPQLAGIRWDSPRFAVVLPLILHGELSTHKPVTSELISPREKAASIKLRELRLSCSQLELIGENKDRQTILIGMVKSEASPSGF